MASDESRCEQLVIEAATFEREAMNFDREGSLEEAASAYRKAAAKLLEAAADLPEDHPDGPVVEQHAREVLLRAVYLEGLRGTPVTVPLEDHINSVQLAMGGNAAARPRALSGTAPAATAPPPASASSSCSFSDDAASSSSSSAGRGSTKGKVVGAAAAIGGAAGLVLMGPVSAVALGAAAAYTATREDKTGSAVRKVGAAGVQAVGRVRTFDEEHRITQRVASVGQTAVSQAKSATSQTQKAILDFNSKHRVTANVRRSLASTGSALSGLVSRASGAW